MTTTNTKVLLKLYALTTPNSYRVTTINPRTRVESTLIEVLESPDSEAVDRSYALAAERGMGVIGHTIDINARMM